jgi:hypothetical protein
LRESGLPVYQNGRLSLDDPQPRIGDIVMVYPPNTVDPRVAAKAELLNEAVAVLRGGVSLMKNFGLEDGEGTWLHQARSVLERIDQS